MKTKGYQESFEDSFKIDESCFSMVRNRLVTCQVDFEGRAVSTSKFVEDDPTTRYKGLKTVDFCIENQQLIGADLGVVQYSLSPYEASYRCEQLLKSIPKVNINSSNAE